MTYLYRVIVVLLLLAHSAEAQPKLPSNNIDLRLKKITYLTGNFDSLTRSFLKRGFLITSGSRDPIGPFTNDIILPNGVSFHLESRHRLDNGPYVDIAKGANVSAIYFETDNLDSVAEVCRSVGFAPHLFGSNDSLAWFRLDSLSPCVITFAHKSEAKRDTSIHHRNGVFRIDWVLLSASADVELRLRALFDTLGVRKYHEGCCDFWRLGDEYDFTLIRFEPAKLKPLEGINKLSIEEGNIYFAF